MKVNPDNGEFIPETYDEAITIGLEAIEFGSDHAADHWGPAVDLKLAELYGDRAEEVADDFGPEYDTALYTVYVDILERTLAAYKELLKEAQHG